MTLVLDGSVCFGFIPVLTYVYCPKYQRMCANKLTAVSAVTRVALFASMALTFSVSASVRSPLTSVSTSTAKSYLVHHYSLARG